MNARPATTIGFRRTKARKRHRCSDCNAQIEPRTIYVQEEKQ